MIPHRHALLGATWLALLACSGCANALPQHAWRGTDSAIHTMKQRDSGVRTFSATCQLLLRASGGDVELSGVLIAQPPSYLRLRASKLSQTVFDITLTPDGLFVLNKGRGKHGTGAAKLLTRDGLIEATSLLPGFSPHDHWQGSDGANDTFSRSRPLGSGESVITCTVDKNTLTTTRCDYLDDTGTAHQSITFDTYRTFGGIVWPMHIVGTGTGGSFEIIFATVEINPDLPTRAFVPSRSAVRQP